MTHIYDWSKLDAGWEEQRGELRWHGDACRGSVYPFLVSVMENQTDDYAPDRTIVDARWCDLYPEARAQLAKCRIAECDHDWDDTCRVCVKCGEEFGFERAPINNTPLFEAMDKMAAEVPAEEWAKVPPIGNCATERFGCTPCPACGKHGLHLCEKFYPEPPSTKWFHPSQPWRRGPLAAWTLVNISNHDGRLTVVMRRGRSEVLIETGPDDETLWERLGKKAVEADKANSKEKCDV